MKVSMQGCTVLVTGGARGIGAGIARAFAGAGANVVIADVGVAEGLKDWTYALAGRDDAERTLASLNELGGRHCALPLDVTNADACAEVVRETVARYGSLDVLVNNAGVVDSGRIADFSEQAWDRIFAVNCKGLFLMSRAAVAALRASKGAIVITASIAGKQGYPNMSAYCASKFAAIGFTQSLAAELAPDGVRVNAICPGMVGTAMWLDHLLPKRSGVNERDEAGFEAAMAQTIPLGRAQTVEDMGEAALYLATAGNVTGVSLSVAGGFEMS
jgi:meso-butanediol dehydrogenase/(S,S)-butanediol dehydrogenase/diacetyl reductase